MKFVKFIIVLVISALTSSVFAAQTAKAFITITSQDGIDDIVKLYEDNAVVDYSRCQADVYSTMGDPVNMWIEANSTTYEKVKLASLSNLVIKFKANSETSFTMTFSNVEGNAIVLKRSDVDTTITADASKSYAFTCTASQELTFTVNPVVEYNYTREVATGKWGTICYPEAITTVSGCEVYQFIGKDATKVYAELVEDALEAGKAYLIYATADAQGFSYTDATTAPASANNGLVGTFAEYTTTTGDEAAYVVKGTSLVPAALGSTVPANRAYVQKLSDIQGGAPAPGRKYVAFSINNPTAIEAVQAAGMKEGKMIVNGQFVIVKDGKMFNAQGAAL